MKALQEEVVLRVCAAATTAAPLLRCGAGAVAAYQAVLSILIISAVYKLSSQY